MTIVQTRRRELSDLNITFPYPSADWTPETGYPETDTKGSVLETPWRPVGIGTHLGLTVSLDSELHDYYCSSTSSAGFKASPSRTRHKLLCTILCVATWIYSRD